jgi:glutaminyl-peptide cyclotransferase
VNNLKNILYIVAAVLSMSLLFYSCGGNKINVPEFSGTQAFEYLEKQVSFGSRVPGSDNIARCREYLIKFYDSLGAKVDTMDFIHIDKFNGKPIPMVNIIASFDGSGGAKAGRCLLAAHYDSRPRAEYDPDTTKRVDSIAGANDGASGVAVLMELANLISRQKPRINIDMALLDGEDYGPPGHLDEYFLGAREMVRRDIKGKYKFALIIDMIGDKDLKIFREEFSNMYSPQITDMVWKTAQNLGETAFVDSVGYAVQDDHLSFLTIKLPSTLIIDFNYKYWHTTHDTPDKCSPESLASVGRVVTTFLYGF